MTHNKNPAAGCTASGDRNVLAFDKRRYLTPKTLKRKGGVVYFLYVDAVGQEHQLKDNLPGVSVRVERFENHEMTWTRNVYRTSDDAIIRVRPRGQGWAWRDDGYDYDGSTLWYRVVQS